MYLRTPKRYTKRGLRRRWLSLRYLWLYIVTPLAVLGADWIWEHQDVLRPNLVAAVDALVEVVTASAQATESEEVEPTPVAAASEDPAVYLAQADGALARGALNDAIENYRRAASLLPNEPEVHYRLAHLLLITNRLEEGMEAADSAILANPESAIGYAIKAMAMDWNGQPEEAVAYALRALELDPNFASAYSFMAEAYADMGLYDEAREAAEQALALDFNNTDAHRNYGYVRELTGYYEEAAQQYEQAIRLSPMYPYLYLSLARTYLVLGRIDDGMDVLLQAAQIGQTMPEVYLALGNAYVRYLGDFESGIDYFYQCIELDPDQVYCLYRLGGLLLNRQDYTEAARVLKRAVDAGADDPEVHYLAAVALTLIGRCDQAVPIIQEGLVLAEDDAELRVRLREALSDCQDVNLDVGREGETATDEGGER